MFTLSYMPHSDAEDLAHASMLTLIVSEDLFHLTFWFGSQPAAEILSFYYRRQNPACQINHWPRKDVVGAASLVNFLSLLQAGNGYSRQENLWNHVWIKTNKKKPHSLLLLYLNFIVSGRKCWWTEAGLFPETIQSNALLILISTEEMFIMWSKFFAFLDKSWRVQGRRELKRCTGSTRNPGPWSFMLKKLSDQRPTFHQRLNV